MKYPMQGNIDIVMGGQQQNYHPHVSDYANGHVKKQIPAAHKGITLTFTPEGKSGRGTWTAPFSGKKAFITNEQLTSALRRINDVPKVNNTCARCTVVSAILLIVLGFIAFGLIRFIAAQTDVDAPSLFLGYILFLVGMLAIALAACRARIANMSMRSSIKRLIAELNEENPFAKWEYTMPVLNSLCNWRKCLHTIIQSSPDTLRVGPTGYHPSSKSDVPDDVATFAIV